MDMETETAAELDFSKSRLNNGTFKQTFNGYTYAQVREFLLFFQRNQRIYRAFTEIAKEIKFAGHEIYSARAIMDIVRYKDLGSIESLEFKIPDQYTPFYARYLVWDFPSFRGFFFFKKVGINRKTRDDDGKTQELIDKAADNVLGQNFIIDHELIKRTELKH